MASFLDVNYLVRPNKNVERKLMADALHVISERFDLRKYQYIGFGAIWFADFVLFHKRLGIRHMVSIEEDPDGASRARFNKPYDCVKVEPGVSTLVLPELKYGLRRQLIWLDYDGDLTKAPVLQDLAILSERARNGWIIMLTLNVHPNQLTKWVNGRLVPRAVVLAELLGVSADEVDDDDASRRGFAPFLARHLFSRFDSLCRRESGNAMGFAPFMNVVYADAAPMLTIGGMVLTARDRRRFDLCLADERFPFSAADQTEIAVPQLTIREKLSLDSKLPNPKLRPSDVDFQLPKEELASYQRYYNHYPLYGEMLF